MLITLAIIGVVAALTIPTVITNYRKSQAATQLKKAYSSVIRIHDMIKFENGGFDPYYDGTDKGLTYLEYSKKYWFPKLKGAKYCESPAKCGYKLYNNCPFKLLNGANYNPIYNRNSKTYANQDGSVYVFMDSEYSDGEYFFIDINGLKEPNIVGKDWFMFYFNKIKGSYTIKPAGYTWTGGVTSLRRYCRMDKDADCCQGEVCAALIMLEGWQIKYDW